MITHDPDRSFPERSPGLGGILSEREASSSSRARISSRVRSRGANASRSRPGLSASAAARISAVDSRLGQLVEEWTKSSETLASDLGRKYVAYVWGDWPSNTTPSALAASRSSASNVASGSPRRCANSRYAASYIVSLCRSAKRSVALQACRSVSHLLRANSK
jgi:hypothetical protein